MTLLLLFTVAGGGWDASWLKELARIWFGLQVLIPVLPLRSSDIGEGSTWEPPCKRGKLSWGQVVIGYQVSAPTACYFLQRDQVMDRLHDAMVTSHLPILPHVGSVECILVDCFVLWLMAVLLLVYKHLPLNTPAQ